MDLEGLVERCVEKKWHLLFKLKTNEKECLLVLLYYHEHSRNEGITNSFSPINSIKIFKNSSLIQEMRKVTENTVNWSNVT